MSEERYNKMSKKIKSDNSQKMHKGSHVRKGKRQVQMEKKVKPKR